MNAWFRYESGNEAHWATIPLYRVIDNRCAFCLSVRGDLRCGPIREVREEVVSTGSERKLLSAVVQDDPFPGADEDRLDLLASQEVGS